MAERPNKNIFAFRLPVDLVKTVSAKAAKQHVSRNKYVELILRHYVTNADKKPIDIISAEEERDDQTLDLFQ